MKKQILRLSGIIVVAALLVMNITFDSNTSAYDTVIDIVVSSALAEGEGGGMTCMDCYGGTWNPFGQKLPICDVNCPYERMGNPQVIGECCEYW